MQRMGIWVRAAAAALAAAMVTGQGAGAQTCQPIWTGTWDTTYGQLRLIEDGKTVYGDYANVGVIKAKIARPCDRTLRGVFVRKDGGKGFIEFRQYESGDGFRGRWNWLADGLPDLNTDRGASWEGTFDDSFPPPITNFKPGESRDSLIEIESRYHNWAKLTDIAADNEAEDLRLEEKNRRIETELAEAAAASAGRWSANTGMTIPWRDVGVIIHHTRFPFLITPASYRTLVEADRNFTRNVPGGSGRLREMPLRLATSIGGTFDENATAKQPADVVLSVYEQTTGSQAKSYCIVSYRGTDQDFEYFEDQEEGAHKKDAVGKLAGEGGIAMNMKSTDLDGAAGVCTVKEGYWKNYNETKSAVMDFLSDATEAGHCHSGILIAGMSLGGATASIAMTDFAINQPRTLPDGRLKTLIRADKVWLVTEGAPRALSRSCVERLPASVAQRSTRFLYGSAEIEAGINGGADQCPRFVDPVPGNPSAMRDGVNIVDAEHFGTPIVGYVPNEDGYQPGPFLAELRQNPLRTRVNNVMEAACVEDPLERCVSARFADAHSRVAGQRPRLSEQQGRDYGGSCLGVDLVPTRKYLFGRFHDTCSYRNLMAAYGTLKGEFAGATNYQCVFPPNPSDPVDGPKSFKDFGYEFDLKQKGPRQ